MRRDLGTVCCSRKTLSRNVPRPTSLTRPSLGDAKAILGVGRQGLIGSTELRLAYSWLAPSIGK